MLLFGVQNLKKGNSLNPVPVMGYCRYTACGSGVLLYCAAVIVVVILSAIFQIIFSEMNDLQIAEFLEGLEFQCKLCIEDYS